MNNSTSAPGIFGPEAFIPPLISSFSTLLRLKGSSLTHRQLAAYLPGGFDAPGAEECLKAASLAGANPSAKALPLLEDIPTPTLPCVLLLGKNSRGEQQSCVLTAVTDDEGEGRTAHVLYPESPEENVSVPFAALAAAYSGYAIFFPSGEAKNERARSATLAQESGFDDSPHWFWNTLKIFTPAYRDAAIASFVVNLLSLAGPLFIMNVYDRVVPNNAVYTLWVLAIGLIIAHFMDFLLRNLRSYFVDTAGRGADVLIASRLMTSVLHMRLDKRPASTGALVNNLREFEQVRDFFGSTTLLALFDLPFLVIFILLTAYIGGAVVLLPLLALPLMLLFVWLVHLPFQRSVERQFVQNMQKNAFLVEVASGIETVKSLLAQGQMARQWENVVEASSAEAARSRRLASLAQTGTLLITYLINAGVIIIGVYRISGGLMTHGGLIACVILTGRSLGPLMQLAAMLTQMQKARISLRALEHIANIPQEKTAEQATGTEGLQATIEFSSVQFQYPGSPQNALRGINLRIMPGEKIGCVGAAGSGKSTLARLAAGLYTPQEGNISFGGVDVRQIAPDELRGRVGYMPQENTLFHGSVKENIVLGCPWADMGDVIRAAQIAGVAPFVARHPQGYDMPVGERGAMLSGGQRQAVALARAILRSPDVLILDEPSSNLDMESEQTLMLRLKEATRDKTLLVLTHRPSLLSLVDRVIVLHEGTLLADGARDTVLHALKNGIAAPLQPFSAGKEQSV